MTKTIKHCTMCENVQPRPNHWIPRTLYEAYTTHPTYQHGIYHDQCLDTYAERLERARVPEPDLTHHLNQAILNLLEATG